VNGAQIGRMDEFAPRDSKRFDKAE